MPCRKVGDRSRAAGKQTRELGRTLAWANGVTKQEVQRLTEEIAELRRHRWPRPGAFSPRPSWRRRGPADGPGVGPLGRAPNWRKMIALSSKVVEEIRQRFAGEKIG